MQFALGFVSKQAHLDSLSAMLAAKTVDDALVWFAYPKGTSKRCRCEFNRDTGWNVLYTAGFRKAPLVAIDADWSALRFGRSRHGKRSTRSASRPSATGQNRAP